MCSKHILITSYGCLSLPHAVVIIRKIWLLSTERSRISIIRTRTPSSLGNLWLNPQALTMAPFPESLKPIWGCPFSDALSRLLKAEVSIISQPDNFSLRT